jgi:drug/metabolite transporter (DMT)-like permease
MSSGWILGLIGAILWALDNLLIAKVFEINSSAKVIDTIAIVLTKELFMFCTLFVIMLFSAVKICSIFKTKEFLWLSIPGILTNGLGTLCYVIAIKLIGSELSGAISGVYPFITFIFGVLTMKYRPNILSITGFILISTALFFNIEIQYNGFYYLIGIILAFCVALVFSLEAILIGYISNITLNTRELLFGKITWALLWDLAVYTPIIYVFSLKSIFNSATIVLIFISSLLSVGSYYFYYKSIVVLKSVNATAINILYIPFISIFSLFYFKIPIFSATILLNCIITIGVILILYSKHNKDA